MTESLKQIVRRDVFPLFGLNGKPAALPLPPAAPPLPPAAPPLPSVMGVQGQLTFSGDVVQKITADIETGLLVCDGAKTAHSLDTLIHLIEMDVDSFVNVVANTKRLNWRTFVLRLVAARLQHALLRIPNFDENLTQVAQPSLSLPQRLLVLLAIFTDLTRQPVAKNRQDLTPQDWLKTPPSSVPMRVNCGVAYYHLSRVLAAGDYADAIALEERNRTFAANFDVMFYALTYGPMMPTAQTKLDWAQLRHHFDTMEKFLQSPQPTIRDDPERLAVPTSHVLHILTTVDRVQQVLPLMST